MKSSQCLSDLHSKGGNSVLLEPPKPGKERRGLCSPNTTMGDAWRLPQGPRCAGEGVGVLKVIPSSSPPLGGEEGGQEKIGY